MNRRGNFLGSGEISYRFTDLSQEEKLQLLNDVDRKIEQLLIERQQLAQELGYEP